MEYKSRKEEKFDSIYQACAKDIYKISMYYAKDEDVAQELTQEAFFKLYVHFDNVNPEKACAWLAQTVKHLAFNRTRDSRSEVAGEEIDFIIDTKEAFPSIEEQFFRGEQMKTERELVESIFDSLHEEHPTWYEALTLVYCLEKPQLEVAEELGISLEVLHSRLYRAKQWIRKHYEDRYSEVATGS